VQVRDKEATPKLIGPLQDELNRQVPGAWITVRQLQTNPVETPVEVLITGQADTDPRTESDDIRSLRGYRIQVMDIVRQSPGIAVLRDDWSPDSPQMKIEIDPDRANLVGIRTPMSQHPRLPPLAETRWVYIRRGIRTSRLLSASGRRIARGFHRSKISTSTHRKRMSKSIAFGGDVERHPRDGADSASRTLPNLIYLVLPTPGVLASEVLAPIEPKLIALKKSLPPGYQLQIGGERQSKLMDSRISLSFF